jgi:hypothetical protein
MARHTGEHTGQRALPNKRMQLTTLVFNAKSLELCA